MAESKDPRTPKMKSVVKAICENFEEKKIQSRKGQGGKSFNYVKAQEYIVKLNDVFGVAWSIETISHSFANNNIVMWVRITYPNPDNPDQLFHKDGWGSHPIAGDPGNAFKSVYSKAFTKAASMIGAGLHLWGVDADEDDAPVWDQMGTPPAAAVPTGVTGLPPVPSPQGTAGSPLPPPPPHTGTGVPLAPPPQVTGHPLPPPPQFSNSGAGVNPGAAYIPPLPPPPIPTGNPGAVDTTQAVGITSGPDTPASAAIGIPSSGRPGGIEDFQVNGILGAAVTRAMDPLQLVASILGQTGITDIGQLTAEQAQRVLDAVRQMPPQ